MEVVNAINPTIAIETIAKELRIICIALNSTGISKERGTNINRFRFFFHKKNFFAKKMYICPVNEN